jgi:hypothetical protein
VVSTGNLHIQVPVRRSEGDLGRPLTLSGWTNSGATQPYRASCAHYVKQHANASGVVKPLEYAYEIGKRPGLDSN